MNIRTMTIGDYESVYALWLSCKGMGLNDLDDSREGIARYLRRNPSTSFVCEADGRIAGVIMAGHDGRRGFIHHTAVHPDFRRMGYGRRILEALVDMAKANSMTLMTLEVRRSNLAAQALYHQCGFLDVGYRKRYYEDNKEDALIMYREFSYDEA